MRDEKPKAGSPPSDRVPAGGGAEPHLVTRRDFLSASFLAALGIQPLVEGARRVVAPYLPDAQCQPGCDPDWPQITFCKTVVRPQDLLVLTFQGINLCLDKGGGSPRLVRFDSSQDSYLIVRFPPQHIAEESFTKNPAVTSARRANLRISEDSRLVFKLNPKVADDGIPYLLEELLSVWKNPENALSFRQFPRRDPPLPLEDIPNAPPGIQYTAIELPYRLILSPAGPSAWEHAVRLDDVTHNDRVELWHTRLTAPADDAGAAPAASTPVPFVAAASRQMPEPFRLLPNSCDMIQVVGLTTSGFSQIRVKRLMLSSLGAWLDSELKVEDDPVTCQESVPPGGDPNKNWCYGLEEWQHQATMGRDQFVKVVRRGYLYPYGHRASWIEIAKRVVEPSTDRPGETVAYLQKQNFVVVREEVRSYDNQSPLGRRFTYQSVRINTKMTPDVETTAVAVNTSPANDPQAFSPCAPGPDNSTLYAFVPQLKDDQGRLTDFKFKLEGVDHQGQKVLFEDTLIFISQVIPPPKIKEVLDEVGKAYKDPLPALPVEVASAGPLPAPLPPIPRNLIRMRGQKVAFAEAETTPGEQPPGADTGETNSIAQNTNTVLQTNQVFFGAQLISPGQAPSLVNYPLHPVMERALVDVPSLKYLVGQGEGTAVAFNDDYCNHGFCQGRDKNEGEVFLNLIEAAALSFKNAAEKVGGLVTPDMSVAALSRRIGPVGGAVRDAADSVKDFMSGKFDPKQFFNGAKILGAIDLSSVIGPILDMATAGDSNVPKLQTRTLRNGLGIPRAVETVLTWESPLQGDAGSLLESLEGRGRLAVTATTVIPIQTPSAAVAQAERSSEVNCALENFAINLLPGVTFVKVKFDRLRYVSKAGQSSRVEVVLADPDGIEFGAELNFVKELAAALNPGQNSGPSIEVSPRSIGAKFKFPIPDLTLGAVSLQNLSVGVGFRLPFTGDEPVSLTFQVGERMNPFTVTYGILGGGGYFMLEIDPSGLKSMAVAIEFGGSAALSISGLASGSAYVMVGFYYSLTKCRNSGNTVMKFAGYQRCGGSLRVLGIVTVSVVFYMELAFEPADSSLIGTATVTVKIKLLFFSKSVSLTLKRKFTGSSQEGSRSFCETVASLPRERVEIASLNGLPHHAPPSPPPPAPPPLTFSDLMAEADWIEYCEAFA